MNSPRELSGVFAGTARTSALEAGREAAVARRRADSEKCRRRVLDVIAGMRKTRAPLSDAEITRRAGVNPQYLQRHRDLKAEAEVVRAHLADSRPRPAAAQAARKEAALQVENRILLEQNQALRKDLETARSELRSLRTRDLTAAARGDLAALPHRDPALKELRRERDEAVAVGRCAEADLVALRRVAATCGGEHPASRRAGRRTRRRQPVGRSGGFGAGCVGLGDVAKPSLSRDCGWVWFLALAVGHSMTDTLTVE